MQKKIHMQIFSSPSFSVLHLINQNVMKTKVQCPNSISGTCLAQEFGLVQIYTAYFKIKFEFGNSLSVHIKLLDRFCILFGSFKKYIFLNEYQPKICYLNFHFVVASTHTYIDGTQIKVVFQIHRLLYHLYCS